MTLTISDRYNIEVSLIHESVALYPLPPTPAFVVIPRT